MLIEACKPRDIFGPGQYRELPRYALRVDVFPNRPLGLAVLDYALDGVDPLLLAFSERFTKIELPGRDDELE